MLGVTADSPLAVTRWITKSTQDGGFGGPLGFPVLSDKDFSLSMSLGVARCSPTSSSLLSRDCGLPARASFIVDWTGTVRYSMVHGTDVAR